MRHLVRACACAAGLLAVVNAGGGAQSPQARAVLPGIDVPIMLDTMALEFPIGGLRDSIYVALKKVFEELKIPVQTANPRAGLLNNLNADLSGRLGGERMSRYIDCGRGFSGPNADFYRLTLAVSAWVEPATGDPQKLMVAIAASGRDPSGSRSYYSPCTSRGDLEKRIARRVQELVGPGQAS